VADTTLISSADLAKILGFSVRRLQQLTKEIPILQASHGKYDLAKTIQTYIAWLKEKTATDSKDDALKDEMLKLTRAKRIKAELELDLVMGNVHKAEDVMSVVGGMVANVRSRLLDLPVKLAPQMIAKTNIDQAREIVQKEVFSVLQSLSEYNPEDYTKAGGDDGGTCE
jgi:phage terminase Nu1 subunit (DNA packaging protein)